MNGIIADLKAAEASVLYGNAFGPSGFDYQESDFKCRQEYFVKVMSGNADSEKSSKIEPRATYT